MNIHSMIPLGFGLPLLLWTMPALAQTTQDTNSTWQLHSQAHGAYMMESSSSSGFKGAGGSAMFFDATAQNGESPWGFGLRTIGSGARAVDDGRQFYRLGTGPLVNWELSPHWLLHASMGFYRESVFDPAGAPLNSFQGQFFMTGWNRRVPLRRRVELLWGGFIVTQSRSLGDTALNMHKGRTSVYRRSVSQGLEIALRIAL